MNTERPRFSSLVRARVCSSSANRSNNPVATLFNRSADVQRLLLDRRERLERATLVLQRARDREEELVIERFHNGGKYTKPSGTVLRRFRDLLGLVRRVVGGSDSLQGHELACAAKLLYDWLCTLDDDSLLRRVEDEFGAQASRDDVAAARTLASQLRAHDQIHAYSDSATATTPTDKQSANAPAVFGANLQYIDPHTHQSAGEIDISGISAGMDFGGSCNSVSWVWLVSRCEQHMALVRENNEEESMIMSATQLARTILLALKGAAGDDALQAELFDTLGFVDGAFEFVSELLRKRAEFSNVSESTVGAGATGENGSISSEWAAARAVALAADEAATAATIAALTGGAGMGQTAQTAGILGFSTDVGRGKLSQKQKKQQVSQQRQMELEAKMSDDALAGLGFDAEYLAQERRLGLQKNQGHGGGAIGGGLQAAGMSAEQRVKMLPAGTKREWKAHQSVKKGGSSSRGGRGGGRGGRGGRGGGRGGRDDKDSGEKKDDEKYTVRYEEVFVPPPIVDKAVLASEKRVQISEFKKVSQVAFKGIPCLNRLQSRLFETAYKTNHNLLVCAPTGAGKTNVAMTTVVREIERHMDFEVKGKNGEWGELDTKSLKIIYVAPMKALAQEVVDKFGGRLKPLGVKVRELTGDMQLTRKEIEETQLIVTTPEKWDVITRKSGDGTLVEQVGLLIIDEVHIVGEDRGPVIEALVARTLRLVEQKQKMVRIVGLSATLPNYQDVALFLRVDLNHGMFFFDSSFRPVPLEQTFLGVVERNTMKRLQVLNELAYVKALDSVRRGHQVMIFVHSRKDAGNTARALLLAAAQDKSGGGANGFGAHSRGKKATDAADKFSRDVAKSRNPELKELFTNGLGIHHAGMARPDRTLTERMFASGALSVLCCTATLAWGVNLPAHTVIIKGTQVYQAAKGGLTELSMQDTFQCFGRAGRPQYDTSGEAILITEHEQLPRYLGMLTHALPLESQLIKGLPDALNAEVVSGTVTNVGEAIEWLSYTFLHIRMLRNPMAYGVSYDEKHADPLLHDKRVQLVVNAAKSLDDAKMTRFGGAGRVRGMLAGGSAASVARVVKLSAPLGVTDLGRVASHYYISHETVEEFNQMLQPYMTDADIINTFCHAQEFAQVKVRDEEVSELMKLARNCCALELKHPVDTEKGKTAVLFQAYVSKARVDAFTLGSDMNHIAQNMGRIARAVFEICLKRGWSSMAERTLVISTGVEKRCWWPPIVHPLRQFVPSLSAEIVSKLENKGSLGTLDHILELSSKEVGQLVRHEQMGSKVLSFARQIPQLRVKTHLRPITRGILRVNLAIVPDFEWRDNVHGGAQSFWVWVEDQNSEWIYHSERFTVSKNDWKAYNRGSSVAIQRKRDGVNDNSEYSGPNRGTSRAQGGEGNGDAWDDDSWYDFEKGAQREFTIPLFEPLPPQYYLRIVSESWMGAQVVHELSLHNLVLPDKAATHTDLLDLQPLPVSALGHAPFESLYANKFKHFNPIQTQMFHVLYHSDQSVLLGAPTGSGKTVAAELALLRLFRCSPGAKAVYIAPLKALVSERMKDWRAGLGPLLNKRVEEMTGDVTPSAQVLERADVLITTPEKWDGVSRMWQQRKYVQQVRLVIIDEIHLLGEERGAVLEVIVSRMRYISQQQQQQQQQAGEGSKVKDCSIRIVGLSTALANARDLGDWLGIDVSKRNAAGLYNFRPAVRPVPLEVHIHGFPGKHYCPRMATMNKPTYQAILTHSPAKPVLVFVASRRQTRLTALDLISFCAASDEPRRFLHMPFQDLEPWLAQDVTNDDNMRDNYGDDEPRGHGHGRNNNNRKNNDKKQDTTGGFRPVRDDALRHTLAFGIGIHHAGLDSTDRELVEHLFCSGKIQVLVCTATLAWGVNFPAHLVVVKGTEFFDAKTMQYQPFPVTDVLQMMGRAGRPQFDDSGVAMILVQESLKNFYKKFLYEPFPVESHLPDYLHNHMNAEIGSGSIGSVKDAVDYLTWTYFFRRLPMNPSYYGLTSSEPSAVAAFLVDMVKRVLDDLVQSRCVEVVSGVSLSLADSSAKGNSKKQKQQAGWGAKSTSVGELMTGSSLAPSTLARENSPTQAVFDLMVAPTALGRVASFYYLDHRTVAMFQTAFDSPPTKTNLSQSQSPNNGVIMRSGWWWESEATADEAPTDRDRHEGAGKLDVKAGVGSWDFALKWILEQLCSVVEYDEVPVRHNEDLLNRELSVVLPWKPSSPEFTSPHVKAFLLLQAHLKRVPMPIKDYASDTRSVLDQALRILNAMVDIASAMGHVSLTIFAMRLAQLIVQGAWWDDPTLCQLPGLSRRIVKQLPNATTLRELCVMGDVKAMGVLKKAGLPRRSENAVRAALRRMPVAADLTCTFWKGDTDATCSNMWRASVTVSGARGDNGRGNGKVPTRFHKAKDEAWWVVIVRSVAGSGEEVLLACKRVRGLRHGINKFSLEFDGYVKDKKGGQGQVECLLVSDSVRGLDLRVAAQGTAATK